MKTFRRIALQLRTIRFLKPSQIYYYLQRRYLPKSAPKFPEPGQVRQIPEIQAPCAVAGIFVDEKTFRFLNVARDISANGHIDWSGNSGSRLWQYNLHYFDFLRESSRDQPNKNFLIDSWILDNPPGSRPGWEPFVTSLRIVNWIFYIWQTKPAKLPTAWTDSLLQQTAWLEHNDERHILANHYFENLKALLFSGCFFSGRVADRWLRRAIVEIPEQLVEQTLSDGGHYERSPQYHCLMLENYLDIYNLGLACPANFHEHFMQKIAGTIQDSLNWLSDTLFPDMQIALFNDSAFGISADPAALFSYAERLNVGGPGPGQNLTLIDRPESGYYGCRTTEDMFIIDCGDIGPSYQPGHTHCDFLSYELMLAGRRVVVDTGVFDYEPGPIREYVRSTSAHNTITVDNTDQSEVWSAFRVARRAKKLTANVSQTGNVVDFNGSYRGFPQISGRIVHKRHARIKLASDRNSIQHVSINDIMEGSGKHTVESYIHLHPSISARPKSSTQIDLLHKDSKIAEIHCSGCDKYWIDQSVYCPEFGKKERNQVLTMTASGDMPLAMSYEIRRVTP